MVTVPVRAGGRDELCEALDALTVRALDAVGGVDAEPAGALPREHVLGDLLVQEAVPAAGTTRSVVVEDAAGHVGLVVKVGSKSLGNGQDRTTCIGKWCPRTGSHGKT
jgi:hypothetical protein